jgi:hypothetical protein
MQATCTTHGEVSARVSQQGDAQVLYCRCGLKAQPVVIEQEEARPALAEGLDPVAIDELLELHAIGGGWFEFEDGQKVRGRAAALRHVMEE